jgi:hypothetical protein
VVRVQMLYQDERHAELAGMCVRNVRNASSPPADAPIPTTSRGAVGLVRGGVARAAVFADLRVRRDCFGLDFRAVMTDG